MSDPEIKWADETEKIMEPGEHTQEARTGTLLVPRRPELLNLQVQLIARVNREPIWHCPPETLLLRFIECPTVGQQELLLLSFFRLETIDSCEDHCIRAVGWNRLWVSAHAMYSRCKQSIYSYAEDITQQIDGETVAGFELLLPRVKKIRFREFL